MAGSTFSTNSGHHGHLGKALDGLYGFFYMLLHILRINNLAYQADIIVPVAAGMRGAQSKDVKDPQHVVRPVEALQHARLEE